MAKRRKKNKNKKAGVPRETPGERSSGRALPPSPVDPASPRAVPSHLLRIVFALGVGGILVLLAAGFYQSLRTEGRLPGISSSYMPHIEALFEAGKDEQAMEQLQLARSLDIVNEPLLLNNLANALQTQGRSSEAMTHYRDAIRIKPDYATPYYNLAKALSEQGDLDQAIVLYRRAVELDPAYADAHNNLATALASQGAIEEAVEHFEQALRFQPDNARAHNNLGWVLEGEGREDDALRHFEEAVRLEPELGAPLIGLSWLLATHPEEARRDPQRALELARRALERLPRPDPKSLDIAAAAHAAAGDYDRAVALAEAAVDLAPSTFPGLRAMRERLALYRQQRPWTSSTVVGPHPHDSRSGDFAPAGGLTTPAEEDGPS